MSGPHVHPLPDPLNDEPCGICGGRGFHSTDPPCRWLYDFAATTPPPVHEIPVVDGFAGMVSAMWAEYHGCHAVELMTQGDGSKGLQSEAHAFHARRAARFARLAMGVTA